MAQAKTLRFSEQALLLGDGESPEVFTAPCGFTTLNLTVNIETNTTNVPDCEDPDLPAWLASDEVSKQMVLGGDGVLDTEAVVLWREWLMEGGERNVRWLTDGATNTEANGYFEAPGILTTYEETGTRGERWGLNIGITLNGAPEWVDLAAIPVVTVAPVLSGTPEVGETLTVTDGTWDNTPTSYGYQWLRNGVVIGGETASTYLLAPADEGATIRARVTAVNAAGSATATSNALGPVDPA